MGSKITSLVTEMISHGSDFQRAYDFEVVCPRLFFKHGPPGSNLGNEYDIGKRIQECSIPFKKIETETEHTTQFVKGILPFESFTMSFLEMDDMSTSACFEEWRRSIYNPAGYIYPRFVATEDMSIFTLRNSIATGQQVRGIEFYIRDAWPMDVEDIKLGSGQNEVVIINVTFQCREVRRGDLVSAGDFGSVSSTLVSAEEAILTST